MVYSPTGILPCITASFGVKQPPTLIVVRKEVIITAKDKGYPVTANVVSDEKLKSLSLVKVGDLGVGGERGEVFLGSGICPAQSATQYKDPIKMLVVRQVGNVMPTRNRDNPNQGRVYDPTGLAPSITSCGGGGRMPYVVDWKDEMEKIRLKANNSKGYTDVKVGGIADLNCPTSKTRRGRVQGDGDIAPAITSTYMELYKMGDEMQEEFRIRKLTPHECWLLMSFSTRNFLSAKTGSVERADELMETHRREDGSFDWIPMMREAEVNSKVSNTQLYKQAGNSICTCCLTAILGQLFEGKEDFYKEVER